MLKGKVNGKGKGKERGSKQSLLGGEGDKAVDDRKIKKNKDESPFMEDSLSVEEHGVSKKDVYSLALTPTPILKPVIRCRFHDGVVTYKEFTALCLFFNSLSSRQSITADIAIV